MSDVKYEALNFKNGEMANETKFKENANFSAYNETNPGSMNKIRYRKALVEDFKNTLMTEISPLLD